MNEREVKRRRRMMSLGGLGWCHHDSDVRVRDDRANPMSCHDNDIEK